MSTLMTSADFARVVGVTRARVSQWKAGGKITAAALVEFDGRTLIDAERACEELGRHLDLSQMTGNGATTRLSGFFDVEGAEDRRPLPSPEAELAVTERYQHEKLREIDSATAPRRSARRKRPASTCAPPTISRRSRA